MRLLAAAPLSFCLAGPAGAHDGDPGPGSGPASGQAIGRAIFDGHGHGDAQLACDFTVFAGLPNLSAGPRSKAIARTAARSTNLRVETATDGTAVDFRTVPSDGGAAGGVGPRGAR